MAAGHALRRNAGMDCTSPIERLQALLVSQIEPRRRHLVAEQLSVAAGVELIAGLADDDDEAVASWLGMTLRALSSRDE